MNRNMFDNILETAKRNNVNSLQAAIKMYGDQNGDSLFHGIDDIDKLFPEYQSVYPGAPELLEHNLTWVDHVMRGVHKSPIARVRTRQLDATSDDLRAKGYSNRETEKTLSGNLKALSRVTDPQTVYRKDVLHRDDITDIIEFDMVNYMWSIMRRKLEEEIARAVLIGDGREVTDPDKISEEHIRPIWTDDEIYTIHCDIDIATAKAELQGSNTAQNFGDNFIYAEAMNTAALHSREKYKGSGSPDFYCAPSTLTKMLLARDLTGRRIYTSKIDLAVAMNVSNIFTVEQFENKIRKDDNGNQHKLLGLIVNMNDYQIGSTRGGELTKFDKFDIDLNTYKYLIEARLSGAPIHVKSAIALEEPIATSA